MKRNLLIICVGIAAYLLFDHHTLKSKQIANSSKDQKKASSNLETTSTTRHQQNLSINETLKTATELKAKSDTKRQSVEDNIRAIERGEAPSNTTLAPSVEQQMLQDARAAMNDKDYFAAMEIAEQILIQNPNSTDAKNIYSHAKSNFK